jgi:protein-tyrosine-phosphatase
MSEKLIVFVCTGNICRSPMAEYMFRDQVKSSHPDWTVCSAGVMAGRGTPASRFGVKVLREISIEMKHHRSQPMTADLVDRADIIVVMTAAHRDILCEQYPEAEPKIKLLKSFDPAAEGVDVMDPIGLSKDVYRYIRDEIGSAMWGLERTMNDEG